MASRRGSPQLRMWVALEGPGALSGRFCSHQGLGRWGSGGGSRTYSVRSALQPALCHATLQSSRLRSSSSVVSSQGSLLALQTKSIYHSSLFCPS